LTYAALIQPVLWALCGGSALFFGSRALLSWRRKGDFKRSGRWALGSLLAAFLLVPAIAVVPPGNRGVIYNWDGGISQKVRGEGVSFVAPWVQHVTTVSVRTGKAYSAKIYAQSSDLQEITAPISVNYHVNPDSAAYLYQHVGPKYQSIVIQPALFRTAKAAIGRVRAIAFALNRDKLALRIEARLRDQLSGYGIVVEYVNIEDAVFDPGFVSAVKNKVIARQKAQEQQNLIAARAAVKTQTIINAQAKARSVLIVATAQAQANRKVAASVTDVLNRWQYLDKWDGTLPTTLVGSGSNPSLFLNIPTG
jgi:prohibitin 2